MTRSQRLVTAAVIAVVVAVTTWPFRSHYLVSWDAANFAFALEKIDIAAHRPHPPGYLGYVVVGRGLSTFFPDANAALTAANVVVRAASGLLIALFAFSATNGSLKAAAAAAAILCTSPLLWFYASNAEIYPSEMAFALATVFAAFKSIRGSRSAIYWTVGLLAITSAFKISAVVLLMPAVMYAAWHWPSTDRWRAAGLFAAIFGVIATIFLVVQPNVLELLWRQFTEATAPSRLGGDTANYGRVLNRNIRNTAVDLVAAIGLTNAGAFVVWMFRPRRLPPAADRWLITLWAGAWLTLLVFVHIGNPGYVLPLLPVWCLLLGAWYARLPPRAFVLVVGLQAAVNLAHIGFISAPVAGLDRIEYRNKTFVERLGSDLEPLTFPTRSTILRNDAAIDRLLAITEACPRGDWVVVAGGGEPVDWRRASYYLPEANVVRLGEANNILEVSQHHSSKPIAPAQILASECGLVWLATTPQEADVKGLPSGGRHVDGVGWVFRAGTGTASNDSISWTAAN